MNNFFFFRVKVKYISASKNNHLFPPKLNLGVVCYINYEKRFFFVAFADIAVTISYKK